MVGDDQKPSKPGHESSGAKADQDDVPPDTQGGSPQPGGSVEGGGVVEGTLVELADAIDVPPYYYIYPRDSPKGYG